MTVLIRVASDCFWIGAVILGISVASIAGRAAYGWAVFGFLLVVGGVEIVTGRGGKDRREP